MTQDPWAPARIVPRARVIIDNDFAGDPDGLVQLAHHLLSPSVEIRGIISSHLRPDDGWNQTADSVARGIELANEVVELCGMTGNVKVVAGAREAMESMTSPRMSEGLELLISEARREDPRPLYIACGGSLTQLASALLVDPDAFKNVIVVWIGGPEHENIIAPPGAPSLEYNTAEDLNSVRVAFATPGFELWQIPRNTYRETLVSQAELTVRMKPVGELGRYLYDATAAVNVRTALEGTNIGETYVMGDSPLVLLTALQSSFEADPSSSEYSVMNRPFVDEGGRYVSNTNGDSMRVYRRLDLRLMFEDFYAKLAIRAAR